MSELNLATLFDSPDETSLLGNAQLTPKGDAELLNARRLIRDRLRERLPALLQSPGASVEQPKFFTQGSYSYKTIIAPLRSPPQQADLDDGVYLSIKDLRPTRPAVASDVFIAATDSILTTLAAEQKGWSVKTSNPNCSRVVISLGAHVDVPRYCMPDDQHKLLVESAALRKGITMDSLHAQGYDEDDWELMPKENVLLAHRALGWIKSDPRPITDWVKRQSAVKGEHFLKVIKILKSWRDYLQWPDGRDPKSILLMALVHHAKWQQFDRRIDKTLLHVVQQLPDLVLGPVLNPAAVPGTADEPDLSKKLDEDDIRGVLRGQLQALAYSLNQAIFNSGDPEHSIALLRAQFGTRLPNEPGRVGYATVMSAPAVVVRSRPPVPKTQAG